MASRRIQCALSVALLVGVLTGTARLCPAQFSYHPPSLDWLVADADVVVRASVADVTRKPVREQWERATVKLKVQETLKGDAREVRTVVDETLEFDKRYEAWQDAERKHLWFLVREGDADRESGADKVGEKDAADPEERPKLKLVRVVRLDPPVPEERGFSALPPPIFDIRLQVLEEPQEILKAVRAAVDAHDGKRVRGHELRLPRGVMQRSGRSGDANFLTLPVDPRLEALARRLIASPGDFVAQPDQPPQDDEQRRRFKSWTEFEKDLLKAEGAKALRHFKSDANIARLKPLLDDPASVSGTFKDDDGNEFKGREYYVRKAAYETLQEWGVEVEKPALWKRTRRE